MSLESNTCLVYKLVHFFTSRDEICGHNRLTSGQPVSALIILC